MNEELNSSYTVDMRFPMDLAYELALLEKALISKALEQTKDNCNKAAGLLGIQRTTLVEKRRKYGFKIIPAPSKGNNR